jgi:5-methylcytosine-specific restriction protein A
MQPCRQPSCPELVEFGYCATHRPANRPERAGKDIYNTKRWKLLRRKKLALNPICQECDNELATEVDHIVGIAERPDLAFTLSNLRSLCKKDHSKKTNLEVRTRRY